MPVLSTFGAGSVLGFGRLGSAVSGKPPSVEYLVVAGGGGGGYNSTNGAAGGSGIVILKWS